MLNYKHFRYTQLHVPTDLYLICKSISKLNYQETCHHTVAVNVVMLLDKSNKVLFICVLFFSYKNPKIFLEIKKISWQHAAMQVYFLKPWVLPTPYTHVYHIVFIFLFTFIHLFIKFIALLNIHSYTRIYIYIFPQYYPTQFNRLAQLFQGRIFIFFTGGVEEF